MDIQLILRTLVYLQSFFWLFILVRDRLGFFIYEKEIHTFFIYVGMCSYAYVLVNGTSFSQYTSELLGLYILMVMVCYGFFSTKYPVKDAIALSFLIVFINSYYWESMHHLNAIVFYGLSSNQITQAFHLIPAYFVVRIINFYNKRKVIKWLIVGMMFSGLHLSSLYIIGDLLGFGSSLYYLTTPITRLFTLGILINIMLDEVKSIKKEWGLDVYY
jgi:hypothetical protein